MSDVSIPLDDRFLSADKALCFHQTFRGRKRSGEPRALCRLSTRLRFCSNDGSLLPLRRVQTDLFVRVGPEIRGAVERLYAAAEGSGPFRRMIPRRDFFADQNLFRVSCSGDTFFLKLDEPLTVGQQGERRVHGRRCLPPNQRPLEGLLDVQFSLLECPGGFLPVWESLVCLWRSNEAVPFDRDVAAPIFDGDDDEDEHQPAPLCEISLL